MVDYRELSLGSWEAAAAGWARWSERTAAMWRPATEWVLDRLDPQPGETILDLAAGTGDIGYLASERLGPDGLLITSDFSPTMLAHARRRAEELGVANVEFRVIDAERIDLDDDSVAGVVCRYGYMLMADPAAALRETRRVLRPGGRVAFTVWGEPERNPWGGIIGRLLVERGVLPPPEPGQPGIFSLADHDRISSLVTGAGFRQVTVEEMALTLEFRDFPDYWDFLTSAAGAVSGVLAALPEEVRQSVRDESAERLAPFADDGGLPLAAVSVNVVAA